jgi:16S rRNA (guanine527-N7)-methyltransferase
VEVAAASNALGQCGGKVRRVELVESFSPEGQRTAVVVVKVAATKKRYPRHPGTPSKKPL